MSKLTNKESGKTVEVVAVDNNLITFADIQAANKLISTTDIKGKEYAEVNQRIKAFRSIHPTGQILTEIVSLADGVCIIKATICDEFGKTIGTGLAYEKEGSSFINKTSYIENCETSAVGRALGMCGLGIDTSVASAEEVQNAIKNQNKSAVQGMAKNQNKKQAKSTEWRDKVVQGLKKHNVDFAEFAKETGLNTSSTEEQFKSVYMETVANWEVGS